MARKSLHNRAESLDRALDLFWKRGYHATSLKDLEQALGLHPGSIYAAFGSKDALFTEALERYAELGQRDLELQLARHPSTIDALAAYVRELGDLRLDRQPSRACMLTRSLLELYEAAPALRVQAERHLAAMEAMFVGAFRHAIECGEIPPDRDPVRLGRRLQVGVMGLRSYALRDGDATALREVAEDMAADLEALRRGARAC